MWKWRHFSIAYSLFVTFSVSRYGVPASLFSDVSQCIHFNFICQVRGELVRTATSRYLRDGLNTLQYSVVGRVIHPLYTHLVMDLGSPPATIVKLDQQQWHNFRYIWTILCKKIIIYNYVFYKCCRFLTRATMYLSACYNFTLGRF